MTMDASAIEAIQKAEATTAAANSIRGALTYTACAGAAALPNDFAVHDLEKFMPTRRRMRGTMRTQSLEAFCDFVKAYAEIGATVFVSPETLTATAVLNLGTPASPGHADMRAILEAKDTAAHAALRAAAKMPMTQMAAAEFVEDWADHITCKASDGNTIATPKVVGALRKLTIESLKRVESEQQQLRATTSSFEDVQAKSADPLPATIDFKCQPAVFLRDRTFTLRLGILTGEKAPAIVLRIIKAEQHQEEMAYEMRGGLLARIEPADPQQPRAISVEVGSYSSGA
jgi:uncharacterized protein YfdQ (DUF2303 family)